MRRRRARRGFGLRPSSSVLGPPLSALGSGYPYGVRVAPALLILPAAPSASALRSPPSALRSGHPYGVRVAPARLILPAARTALGIGEVAGWAPARPAGLSADGLSSRCRWGRRPWSALVVWGGLSPDGPSSRCRWGRRPWSALAVSGGLSPDGPSPRCGAADGRWWAPAGAGGLSSDGPSPPCADAAGRWWAPAGGGGLSPVRVTSRPAGGSPGARRVHLHGRESGTVRYRPHPESPPTPPGSPPGPGSVHRPAPWQQRGTSPSPRES